MNDEKWEEYRYSYQHGRSQWSFIIQAESMEDAMARVESIKKTLRLDGMMYGSFPFSMPTRLGFSWMSIKRWLSR